MPTPVSTRQPGGSAPTQRSQALAPRPACSLSPSRAADFVKCPLLYRFRAIDRLPEPPSAAATRGTLVHGVLEALFDLPAEQRTLEQARRLLAEQWSQMMDRDPQLGSLVDPDDSATATWLAGGARLLSSYFQLEDPTRLEPQARELALSVALPSGLTLRGYVDRLDASPDGALRVVDYKTGRAPGMEHESAAMFQLRFYALAIWHQLGRLPALLQLMYLSDGVILRLVPEQSDLRATTMRVEALWAAIERSTSSGDWRANPGRACDWCAHRSICPAWGGTPPPAPTTDHPAGQPDLMIDLT